MLFSFPQDHKFNLEIYNHPRLLPPKIVNKILSLSKEFEFQDAVLGKDSHKDELQRVSNVKWLDIGDNTKLLYDLIFKIIKEANDNLFAFDLLGVSDPFQYTEYYGNNKGKYDWHVDLMDHNTYKRKLSMTIQLSSPDEYEGGVLQTTIGGSNLVNVPKHKGLITIFPSYILHRVTPVTKGTRKSLVAWFGGKPFR